MQDKTPDNSDMLAVFDQIEVDQEPEIPMDDKAYCERMQAQCHAALRHLKTWHDRFRSEAEKYSDQFAISYSPSGSVEISLLVRQDEQEQNEFKEYYFYPFKIINNIADNYRRACYFFGSVIMRYFEEKYRFSILRPDCEDTISVGFLPDYKLYVDHIISRLNGQTFREKAEEEIIIRSLFASKRRERGTAPELRDNKILFYDIVEMDDYQRSIGRYQIAYGTDTFVNNICAGWVLYATQSIQGNIGSIPEFNQYNVQVGKWYDMKMDKIEAIRFYVNGRIDVRFSTPTAAAECFHFLRLYSLANH